MLNSDYVFGTMWDGLKTDEIDSEKNDKEVAEELEDEEEDEEDEEEDEEELEEETI